jgi:outer membrane protein assembly factor BamA
MDRPNHRARSRVVAGLLVAAGLALAPRHLHAQREAQREAPEVRKLIINGVHGVSRNDLTRSIATTASQCKSLLLIAFCAVSKSPTFIDRHYLDHDEFRRDVLRLLVFYWKRGYRDATVDTAVTREGPGQVRVTFNVNEGPPTRIASWRVEYDSTLMSPRRVKSLSYLRAGDPLNLVVLDTIRMNYVVEMWN